MFKTYEIINNNDTLSKTRGIKATGKDLIEALINFVKISQQEKKLKEEKESYTNVIRNFIKEVRDFFSSRGDFIKTYRVEKEDNDFVYAVDVSKLNKYTLPTKREDLEKMKRELTVGIFNQLFEETLTIKIKDIIVNNPQKRKELTKVLIDALGEEKVKEYFIKKTIIEPKEDIEEKIYQLSEEERKIFFKYVKESTDSVKDVSYYKKESDSL
jgi:hypothetical protein